MNSAVKQPFFLYNLNVFRLFISLKYENGSLCFPHMAASLLFLVLNNSEVTLVESPPQTS